MKNRRREALILVVVLALLAALFRLMPRPAQEEQATAAVWGIRLGMTEAEATAAFGREPLGRGTFDRRRVAVYGRASDLQDAVVVYGADGVVAAVRGSAIDWAGRRLPLPLTPRLLARVFGDCATAGDQQKWYPNPGVGFQFRNTVAVSGGTQTHATCAWIGGHEVMAGPWCSGSSHSLAAHPGTSGPSRDFLEVR